ncbi:NADH-quinone oxidoreductase subunit N [Nakamurella endophytica]|uniref:NADH-quinone oxidoreductase subunit N n=1 Tax=Nakamurella endophytica TaxID=1748367 RepID=A0A917T2E4_9ACTN|nr:proton-conducting transporter membrane subunit [Nakamurella endophytica]GGM08023.1 NADH-quinone oxidoreductase subunit N [Nakamurella endophytica]
MGEDPLALLPEICLLAGAIATLLTGSFLPRQRQWIARIVALAACGAAATAAVVALAGPDRSVFADSYAVDAATGTVRLVIAVATALVLLLGTEELRGSPRESETCCLVLLSATGAVVLAGTTDLMVLAVAYLLTSIPLYALIGISRTARAAEAVMKTYLLGALFGIVMLLGVTLLFAMTGGTGYAGSSTSGSVVPAVVAVGAVAVLAGLLFEAGAVPGHFWVPDAAQGASTAAAAFLTTVPKVGALVAMYRLIDALPGVADWPLLVAALSALSMTVGTFAAFAQRDPRRLLGWSTVSQVGFLLLPVAVAGRTPLAEPSLLLYLAGYAVSNLAAFAVVAAVPHRTDLAAYRGLGTSRPWLAGALLVALLSLVGTPPTAVFLGKLTTFTAAWDGGLAWLVIVAAVNTVASLFYFLRWLAPTFARPARAGDRAEGHVDRRDISERRPWAERTVVLAAAGVLLLGVGAGSLPILGAIP